MSDDSPDIPQRPVEIDLEPLPDVVVDTNVDYQAPYYPGVSQRGDHGLPIPNQDGHLCPNCNYDVRGLKGRICPECGKRFTIGEARITGKKNDPDHQLDLRVIAEQRWTTYASVLLYLGAFSGEYIVERRLPAWGDLALQLILLMPFALTGMMYCYCLMRPGREGFFVSALLYAAFSVVLMFM